MHRSRTLPSEHREDITTISGSGEYPLSLLNDVLDMSKIDAGRTTLNPTEFNLHSLLEEVENLFRLRAEEKSLFLCVNLAENLPQYIQTDQVKLKQILVNLVSNAVKFTQSGGVTLNAQHHGPLNSSTERAGSTETTDTTEAQATDTPETQAIALTFTITDSGPGIAPDEIKTIFEPFVQSQSGLASQEGTGLGLPISRKFAQLMGGDITLENHPSQAVTPAANNPVNEQVNEQRQGMIARVHIQAHKVLGTHVKAYRTERSVIALAAGQPRYKILVVDDKAPNRQLLVKLLGPIGFELIQNFEQIGVFVLVVSKHRI